MFSSSFAEYVWQLLSESFEAVCIELKGDGASEEDIVRLKAIGTVIAQLVGD